MGILRLSHIGICVSDLESALAFYRDGLGFRELSRLDVSGTAADTLLELPGTQLRAVYLERDAVRIELLWFEEPGDPGRSRRAARKLSRETDAGVALRSRQPALGDKSRRALRRSPRGALTLSRGVGTPAARKR